MLPSSPHPAAWRDAVLPDGTEIRLDDPTCDRCCAVRPVYRLLGATTAMCAPCFATAQVASARQDASSSALPRRHGPVTAQRVIGTRRPRAATPAVRPPAARPPRRFH